MLLRPGFVGRIGQPFRLGRTAWSPSTLFASGEQGVWYDLNLTEGVLYQDSAGTTAVTAVEQPVGLMLDKSKGLVLGSELVANGGFTTDISDWNTLGSPTISVGANGVSITNNGSTAGSINQALSTTPGRTYKVVGSIVYGGAGFARIEVANSAGNPGGGLINVTASGTYNAFFTATSSTTYIIVGNRNDLNATHTFDNVSVRELAGNHAFNTNATTVRPVLSARYNLLTYSEQFDNNAAWILSAIRAFGSGSVADAIAAPDGTMTADFVVPTSSAAPHFLTTPNVSYSSGVAYKFSVYAKAGGYLWLRVALNNANFAAAGRAAWFDIANGALGTVESGVTATILPIGNDGWYLCSVTATATSTGAGGSFIIPTDADNTTSFTANGNDGIYIWGADLRVANESATIPYQRVTTATDYDSDPTKFPYYLAFDGATSNRWLQTASIDFSTVTSDGLPRRNLLSFPTAFNESVWTISRASINANTSGTTDPLGGNTADKLVEDSTASNTHRVFESATFTATTHTWSVYCKAAERNWVFLRLLSPTSTNIGAYFDISVPNGTVGTVSPGVTASISLVGDGWYRCSITASTQSAPTSYIGLAAGDNQESYTGNGASGIYIWGAQLETGSTATAFQNIGTDKMSVFAGVRKLSDAVTGVIVESSLISSANSGAFVAYNEGASGKQGWGFNSRGTDLPAAAQVVVGYAAPITNILTGLGDISGDSSTLRINGEVVATNTADQGTGNFGNYPLYIGRRGGTTLPFNGRLYSLIVRGALTDAATIALAEDYVETKTFGKNMNIVYIDPVVITTGGEQVTIDGEDVYVTSRYE